MYATTLPDRDETQAKRAGKPTLLFVDDEERILRSLRMMFAQQYTVRTTTSGHEALDILRREHIHTLVSDQRMPIMPGVELLRQAREVSPNTMRLLLTGYSDLDAVTGSINEGEIYRYITKPWNPDEIRQTIGTAVDIALRLEISIAAPVAAEAQPEALGCILVIDDDPDVATQVRNVLEGQSETRYRVEWASDVAAVFRVLKNSEVALVVTDVRLGGEDITDLIKNLKRHQPHVVTLAITSYQDSSTLVSLINQAQIHRYLLKPIRHNLIWRGIDSGLQRHRAMKIMPAIAARHRVEEAKAPATTTPTSKRILDFFRELAAKPH